MSRELVLAGRLTSRQESLLDCITALTNRCGRPPTMLEVAAELGMRTASGVHYQVDELAKQGLVTREPGKPRTLRVVQPERATGEPDSSALLTCMVGRVREVLSLVHDPDCDNASFRMRVDRILRGEV